MNSIKNNNTLNSLLKRLKIGLLIAAFPLVIPLTIVAYGASQSANSIQWQATFWAVLLLAALPAWLLFNQAFNKVRRLASSLWQAESHWRHLIALSGDWYWEQDVEGCLVHVVYRGMTHGADCPPSVTLPLVGQKHWEIPGVQLCHQDWSDFKKTLQLQQPFEKLLFLYTSPQGRRIYFESTGRPMVNEAGVFIGYLGISVNVTQRVLSERLLQAERSFLNGILLSAPIEQLLKQLITALPEAMSQRVDLALWGSVDSEKTLQFKASTHTRIRPISHAVPVRSHDIELISHPLHGLSEGVNGMVLNENQLSYLLETGHGAKSAHMFFVKGDDHLLRSLLLVFMDSEEALLQDEFERLNGICQVISLGFEYVRFENELLTINQSLEDRVKDRTQLLSQTNQDLEAFTYTVSHDLRAPLRAIDGFTSILKEDFKESLPDQAQHLLGRISSNARQMGQLIDGLLDFSRLLKTDVARVEMNMNDMVVRVCEQLNASAQARLVIEALPPAKGDPVLIQQIWMNLIDNALKFSKKSAEPTVTIRSEVSDGSIHYHVQDNGAGFDMAYKNKLFNVFERLHHKKDFDGTGVGLATVKRIMDRHGGAVSATGQPGHGATFSFSLPIDD